MHYPIAKNIEYEKKTFFNPCSQYSNLNYTQCPYDNHSDFIPNICVKALSFTLLSISLTFEILLRYRSFLPDF
jgi:hypothetical protein